MKSAILGFLFMASSFGAVAAAQPEPNLALTTAARMTAQLHQEMNRLDHLIFADAHSNIVMASTGIIEMSRIYDRAKLPGYEVEFIISQKDLNLKFDADVEKLMARLIDFRKDRRSGLGTVSSFELNGIKLITALRDLEVEVRLRQETFENAMFLMFKLEAMTDKDKELRSIKDELSSTILVLMQLASAEHSQLNVIARYIKEIREQMTTGYQMAFEGVPGHTEVLERSRELINAFYSLRPGFKAAIKSIEDIKVAIQNAVATNCESILSPATKYKNKK